MRVLCCGDRNWYDMEIISNELSKFPSDTITIHGNARGADRLCALVASNLHFSIQSYPAEWEKYGKAAGPIRNQQMLDEGKPELVLAFHNDIERSKGTKDMIKRAKSNGIKVKLFNSYGHFNLI